MADTPRRRATDRARAVRRSSAPVRDSRAIWNARAIWSSAASCIGDGAVRGALTLSEGGRWEGQIQAEQRHDRRRNGGRISVSEKLEIRNTARIRGAVTARSIAVAQGAVIEGDMAVTSGAPVVHYERESAKEWTRKRIRRSCGLLRPAPRQHPVSPLIHCVSSATPAVSTRSSRPAACACRSRRFIRFTMIEFVALPGAISRALRAEAEIARLRRDVAGVRLRRARSCNADPCVLGVGPPGR